MPIDVEEVARQLAQYSKDDVHQQLAELGAVLAKQLCWVRAAGKDVRHFPATTVDLNDEAVLKALSQVVLGQGRRGKKGKKKLKNDGKDVGETMTPLCAVIKLMPPKKAKVHFVFNLSDILPWAQGVQDGCIDKMANRQLAKALLAIEFPGVSEQTVAKELKASLERSAHHHRLSGKKWNVSKMRRQKKRERHVLHLVENQRLHEEDCPDKRVPARQLHRQHDGEKCTCQWM